MANNIVQFDFNGYKIRQRSEDEFVNITDMAKSGGKRVGDYLDLSSTKSYVAALSTRLNKLPGNLVVKKEGRGGGTFAHPEIAIDCAQWVSMECKLWANQTLCRYVEADTTLIGDVAERSTDAVGLNREMGRVRDRLKLVEGKDFSTMRDGTTSLTPVLLRSDDTDSSYAKVLHIAQHEMSDEELIRAGILPSNVVNRQNIGHPEMIDAIADYLGLIKNGWIDALYRMRRDRIARKQKDFLEEMEDVAFLRSRQRR
jgi:KilA-N domain